MIDPESLSHRPYAPPAPSIRPYRPAFPDGTFPASGRSLVFDHPATREYWDNDDTQQYSLLPDGKGFLMMRRVRRTTESVATRLILRERVSETR